MEKIAERVEQFNAMRPKLKQLSQKMVERWIEHYRLYKCEICGQYWQATLAPRDSDTWYLFKIPKISIKAWKETVFVSPGDIAVYLEEQAKFLKNEFDSKKEPCNENGCKEPAITGSLKCKYHQFLQIGFGEELVRLSGQRWNLPYMPEILKPNEALNSTPKDGAN